MELGFRAGRDLDRLAAPFAAVEVDRLPSATERPIGAKKQAGVPALVEGGDGDLPEALVAGQRLGRPFSFGGQQDRRAAGASAGAPPAAARVVVEDDDLFAAGPVQVAADQHAAAARVIRAESRFGTGPR